MCVGYNSLWQSLISPPSTCYPLPRQKNEAHTVYVPYIKTIASPLTLIIES